MNRKKAADSRLAGFLFVALSLLVFLLTAVLLFANVRLVPIQTDGVPIAPDALVWEVTKLEGEGTVLVEGAVLLPGADTISVSITALLRDPETGQCYRIPTALRTPDMLSILPKDPVLSLEESGATCFFARGIPLGVGIGGRELVLLYEDGVNSYLIETDRRF